MHVIDRSVNILFIFDLVILYKNIATWPFSEITDV